jgi:hypothetical protein
VVDKLENLKSLVDPNTLASKMNSFGQAMENLQKEVDQRSVKTDLKLIKEGIAARP